MVTYRFDAMPHALQIAIPRTYNDTLFHEGETIVVDGKKSKRGVMRAKHVVI